MENQQENQGEQVLYASFWARLAAYFIDRLVIGIMLCVLIIPVSFASEVYNFDNEIFEAILGLSFIAVAIVGGFSYFVYMTYKHQATLGKMAVGVRVLNEQGKKPTLNEVMMREVLGKIVSAFTLKIGYLIAAFTNKNQALHDMIGKSIVVCQDQKKGLNKVVVIVVNICFISLCALMTLFYAIVLIALIVSEGSF